MTPESDSEVDVPFANLDPPALPGSPFVMQRLDNEYRMRPSEAPLLRRLPSEYIREFFSPPNRWSGLTDPSISTS